MVDSESKIIRNFDITIERFGFGSPVEETFPNGESRRLFAKASHKVTDSSSLHAESCDHKSLKYKPHVTIMIKKSLFSKLSFKF